MKKPNYWIIVVLVLAFLTFLIEDFFTGFNQVESVSKIVRLFTHLISVTTILVVIPSIVLFFKRKKDLIIVLWCSFFGSGLVSIILKLVVARPRPFGIITEPAYFYNIFSFPSSHATMAFAALPLLIFAFHRQRMLIILYGAFVALSRVYFQVHFVSDVVFGAIIGYIVGMFVIYFKDTYKDFNIKIHDKLEVRRKVFHILIGLGIVTLIYFDVLNSINLMISIIVVFLLFFMTRKVNVPLFSWLLTLFERKKYVKRFPGKGFIFYLIGAFIVVSVFEKDIAMASIIILAFADSISHIFGHFGRMKHPFSSTKYFEGFIFGTFFGFIFGSFFVSAIAAFFASLIAMFFEGFNFTIKGHKIDDNLMIPVVAGIIIWVVGLILG